METNTKIVDFTYCETCKYKDTDEAEDPCNECLTVSARNDGSKKPVKYWENE